MKKQVVDSEKLKKQGCKKDIDFVVREYLKGRGYWSQIDEIIQGQSSGKASIKFTIDIPHREEMVIGYLVGEFIRFNNETNFLIKKLVFASNNCSTDLVYDDFLQCCTVI